MGGHTMQAPMKVPVATVATGAAAAAAMVSDWGGNTGWGYQ